MTTLTPTNILYDVAIVGTGPAGLAAALALAAASASESVQCRIALIGPPPRPVTGTETRTTALFGPSLTLLDHLGVLKQLDGSCASISGIRLIDDTGRLLRAPETTFSGADLGLDRLGLNVPNATLVDALEGAVLRHGSITRIPTRAVTAVDLSTGEGVLTLADGECVTARLIVAADGRQSLAREAASIAIETWDYDQVAITATFAHASPHAGVSSELHRQNGPCTTVPLPGDASSLVWVERPSIAARLMALDDAAFRAALEFRLKGLLGAIREVSPRRAFPLGGLLPKRFAARRVALVGEAAHVFPPIGAQGLNLGLRDGASLAEGVARALAEGRDPGGGSVLDAYHANRTLDVTSRTYGVDLLGRTLTSQMPFLGLARGVGLHLARNVPALRRAMIEAGLRSVGPMPRLMQQTSVEPAAQDVALVARKS